MITGRRFWILLIIAIILLIPLVAMQFTPEVDWSFFDFVLAGSLLFTAGFLFDLTLQKVQSKNWRILVGFGILILFFMIWAELAVGIFGTPFSGD